MSAPLLRRLGSLVYETLLLAALVLLTGFALLPLMPITGGHTLAIAPPVSRAVSFAAIVVVIGAYCVYFWSGGRRTLPMKTWRLALVRADGAPVTIRTAIVRYAAAWIGPALAIAAFVVLRDVGHARQGLWLLAINFAWAFVDRERLFLHDRIAQTRVVAARR